MIAFLKPALVFALYVTGIIVFFASLSGKVKWGLLFLVPLLPLQNVMDRLQMFPMGKDLNDLLMVGMVLGWFFIKATKKEVVFSKSAFNILLFFYILYSFFTLIRGAFYLQIPLTFNLQDPRVQNWKNFIFLPVLFFLILNNLRDKKELQRMLVFMCLSMLIMDRTVIKEISWMTSWISRDKLGGTFVWLGANEVAAFYATYTFVLIGLFFFLKDKRIKILLGVLIALNLYCDLFAMSRGAYLATLVALLFIALARVRKLIFPILLVLLMWQTILPAKVMERIQYTDQGEGRLDDSAESRLIIWETSMQLFQESPIIGVGFNTLREMGMRDTHNIYVKKLAEEGLLGLIFLLAIFLVAMRRSWRLYKTAHDDFLKGLGFGFCACVIAVMVGNFFGDRWTPLPLSAFFWVFLGMVERGNIIVDNNAKSKNKNNPAN